MKHLALEAGLCPLVAEAYSLHPSLWGNIAVLELLNTVCNKIQIRDSDIEDVQDDCYQEGYSPGFDSGQYDAEETIEEVKGNYMKEELEEMIFPEDIANYLIEKLTIDSYNVQEIKDIIIYINSLTTSEISDMLFKMTEMFE